MVACDSRGVSEFAPIGEIIDPDFLLSAYASGMFPMAMEDGHIGWFSPEMRGVIPLDEFHIPKGLRRVLKKQPFEIRVDTAFLEVIEGCAERDETWISETIVRTYWELHRLGCAHSVEAWRDGELVGGLYGVRLGSAFFGESMFSRVSEASKVSLVHLVERMRAGGFTLLDTQWSNDHLVQFGCVEMPADEYDQLLDIAVDGDADWWAIDGGRPE
ncbi:leucyl/phenylalanyl-tRNA--protein transferase [Sulfuriroseicoccus oceanibius]|uniref:Leucyl/phenylalanyl-tRNA--protein transferase n=1 Tax=Sulfuriroseicoccus oceanibius TaxID=2707525 RepID=A0A6B3L808_9BACT|nr:leucyl/phenylalanyl-tRNA--protein transferase [Sulfuriroseicoccus oceanibius]QQL46387.1 leucyl/phenylalanyl-tRNA--protein transferase [Sulfuriroseicoccus oceanibius]